MAKKDRWFIGIAVATSAFLFSFVFWLGFPGFFQCRDIYDSLSVTTDHWHPVAIARFLQCLYCLFGRHSFYLFALNLFCLHAGTLLFVLAFYLRTRKAVCYALFAATFIGNIFFQNFVQLNNVGLSMLLWLGCSMVFFQILVPITNARVRFVAKGLTGVILILALLWRHNAILSVYPLTMLPVYMHLTRKGLINVARFTASLVAVACVLVFIVKAYPHLLSDNVSKTQANHIFLHQIAGMVVPANDRSFIPNEWYEEGKGFDDVVELYGKYPTFSDPFNVGWEPFVADRPFAGGGLDGLEVLWLKGIFTYPANYLKHVSGFIKTMWFQNPDWMLDSEHMQRAPVGRRHVEIASSFPENERHIAFTPLRKNIYGFLFGHKVVFNHIVGVATGFLILLVGSAIWIVAPRLCNEMLLFSMATSLSSVCTAIGVCIFCPATNTRYMSPVLVLSLISLIGFAAWCWLVLQRKGNN